MIKIGDKKLTLPTLEPFGNSLGRISICYKIVTNDNNNENRTI